MSTLLALVAVLEAKAVSSHCVVRVLLTGVVLLLVDVLRVAPASVLEAMVDVEWQPPLVRRNTSRDLQDLPDVQVAPLNVRIDG